MCGTCFIFNIVFRSLGAGDGGILAMIALWFSIVGVGGLVNTNYLLIELRVPPEHLRLNQEVYIAIQTWSNHICLAATPIETAVFF